MISILLLDTFDDYFNLYWNYDKGLLEKNEKVIITTNTSDKLIEIDSFNKTINYSGPFSFYTRFIKQYLSILLTLFFIFASLYFNSLSFKVGNKVLKGFFSIVIRFNDEQFEFIFHVVLLCLLVNHIIFSTLPELAGWRGI